MIIIFVLILIFISFRLHGKTVELFQSEIQYLSKEETGHFLSLDEDEYIRNLKPMDLLHRNAESNEKYLERAIKSSLDFSDEQKQLIDNSIRKAQERLLMKESKYIENDLIVGMNWKISLTDGSYELGLPHTRSDIIFLTPKVIKRKDLVDVLIHEKVHIYQRRYKEKFKKVLLENGYTIVNNRNNRDDLRSNPDLDEFVYEKDGNVYDEPKGIFEHPNEEIAYAMENK